MSDEARLGPVDRLWLVVSSLRTTALLVIVLTGVALVSAIIPQGRDAVMLLNLEHTELLQSLAAWGLTDIFSSAWVRALCVLIGGNVVAVMMRLGFRGRGSGLELAAPPSRAPHEADLTAAEPEAAVEVLRESFREVLGSAPADERVDGARVSMAFDANPRASLAPLFLHFGLIGLVVGAMMDAEPPPREESVVRALLAVQDSSTGTVGTFDMVESESRQFFRWRGRYFLGNYLPSRKGLGPAVQIVRLDDDRRQRDEFWVYLNAPPGFDKRHRAGNVSIDALQMGLAPAPGAGLSSSTAGLVLLAGFGLLLAGAFSGTRADGRLWVDVEGDRVRLSGVPAVAHDAAFARAFDRWRATAEYVLEV